MFNTAPKRIGWFCLFCLVYICGWFTVNIVVPSLKVPTTTKPIFKVHTNRFGSDQIAFSPDGKRLLWLGNKKMAGGNSIRRWNFETGKELPPITSHEGFSLLSKDGRYYTTYDESHRKANVYRLSDQKLIATIPLSKDESLVEITGKEPLSIISEAKIIVSTDNRRYIASLQYFIQDIHTHKLQNPTRSTFSIHTYDGILSDQSVAISPDGSKVLSMIPVPTEKETRNFREATDSKITIPINVKRINRLTGKTDIFPSRVNFIDPFSLYQTAQISNDNTLYAAVSTAGFGSWGDNGEDGSIWCYDLPHQKLRWKYFQRNHMPLLLQFSPDGTMIAAGGYDSDYRGNMGFVYVLDTKTGKLLRIFGQQTWKDQLIDRTRFTLSRIKYKLVDTIDFYRKTNRRVDDFYYSHQFAPNDSGVPRALS